MIYVPDEKISWANNSALTPTPILIEEEIIRIFCGFRDDYGVSRIGYVDVDANNPSKILSVSKHPVLNIGPPGCFDDNGVILGDVIRVAGKMYMYYIGFQLVDQVKFLAFTGLAISHNGGDSFERISSAPVMDRSDEGLYFRAIHSLIYENGVFKSWYACGSEWSYINGKPYPKYHIKFMESVDGIKFSAVGILSISFEKNEYRIGRPRVSKFNGIYQMYYTVGTLQGSYLPGYAESKDGLVWNRLDSKAGIKPSLVGWDSKALSYATPLTYKNREYLFYNGNDMGKTGFGYAERKLL